MQDYLRNRKKSYFLKAISDYVTHKNTFKILFKSSLCFKGIIFFQTLKTNFAKHFSNALTLQ